MIDLVEGGLAWTRDHSSQIHVAKKESLVFRKVEDDHVNGSTGNRLLSFKHVKGVEAIDVKTERKAYLISPTTEEASSVNIPEIPENRGIPDISHDRCCRAITGLTE
jgi:hypothetical protein